MPDPKTVPSLKPGLAPQHRTYSAGAVLALLAIAVAVVVAPALSVRFPPLNDYPFHLARIWILDHLDDPVVGQFYEAGNWLLPNIAMDVVALGLARLVGAEAGTKIFLVLWMAGLLAGPALLHRAAHGRWSVWPMLAGMLVFNGILRWGFMNFLFGVGLAFGFAAWWMWTADRRLQLWVGVVGGVLTLFCHLAAFGVFAVIVSSYELTHCWQNRHDLRAAAIRLTVSVLPFLACLVGFVALSPTSEGGEIAFPGIHWKAWGGVASLSSAILWLDLLTVAFAGALVLALAMCRQLRVSAPLAVAAVMMGAVFVACPDRVGSFLLPWSIHVWLCRRRCWHWSPSTSEKPGQSG